jgi:hypothetical protein
MLDALIKSENTSTAIHHHQVTIDTPQVPSSESRLRIVIHCLAIIALFTLVALAVAIFELAITCVAGAAIFAASHAWIILGISGCFGAITGLFFTIFLSESKPMQEKQALDTKTKAVVDKSNAADVPVSKIATPRNVTVVKSEGMAPNEFRKRSVEAILNWQHRIPDLLHPTKSQQRNPLLTRDIHLMYDNYIDIGHRGSLNQLVETITYLHQQHQKQGRRVVVNVRWNTMREESTTKKKILKNCLFKVISNTPRRLELLNFLKEHHGKEYHWVLNYMNKNFEAADIPVPHRNT